MVDTQTIIDFVTAGYVDSTGKLHGTNGKYATPAQLQAQRAETERLQVIAEHRRSAATWRTLHAMAAEIIELRQRLKNYQNKN